MPTPYQIFYNEIPSILKNGPKSHREIAASLKLKFSYYCDDSIPCPHLKSDNIQPEWDHHARNAEQALKKKNIIEYDSVLRKWQL